MNKVISLIITLLLSAIISVYGQKEKNVVYKVGVGELLYAPSHDGNSNTAEKVLKNVTKTLLTGQSSSQHPQYTESVRTGIINGLSKVKRFRTFDGDFSETEILADIPILYISGTINNISIVSKTETTKDNKGKKSITSYYRGHISLTVNLQDAHNGTIVDSHIFTTEDGGGMWMASGEKAISNALEHLSSKVVAHYNKRFPIYASIIKGGNFKKDKMQDAYIDLGFTDGVVKGLQFDVYLVKDISGMEAKTIIGRLKIEEVKGDEISLCKITKGGDKIKKALDEDQILLITSR